MNNLALIIISVLFSSILNLHAKTIRDAVWLEQKMADLDKAKQVQDINQRIEAIADCLAIASYPPSDQFRKSYYQAAQQALLAIPQHADHYKEKIEYLRNRIKSGSENPDNIVMQYRDAQGGLNILGGLPSPQSVAVLGHFINDPEGMDGNRVTGQKMAIGDGFKVNCITAMMQLNRIGIAHPPARADRLDYNNQWEYVKAWKDWWNEVAAGKRTYRFIGSDVEYGPDGPVSKEVLERIKRDQKRDEERAAGRNRSSVTKTSSIKEAPKPWTIGGLIASCLLCAGAVWYFLRNRKIV